MSPSSPQGALQMARLMLIFSPDLAQNQPALESLRALLPHIDVLQLRIKPKATSGATPGSPSAEAPARETYDWTVRALELCKDLETPPLVIVNDRVDVALALSDQGVDGVHLGAGDFPVEAARRLLGPDMLIGLSTHNVQQVVMAAESGADYVGFGPIFATDTKGYSKCVGPEAAWIASVGSSLPLFPIGGIDATNIQSLAEVGRAAVASALLNAEDPARAAQDMASVF
jgi:thiamine-phosphate diphosphorylase